MSPQARLGEGDRRARELGRGEGLAFVIGPFRGGTTLLRKILDSHSQIQSPAETWFLLPLLNLWEGRGKDAGFDPSQASAAIRGLVNQDQFIRCCRAFAGMFYAQQMVGSARWFVDKTPMYLQIADVLVGLFPRARFIVLVRDPRGLCWSRHTWRHANSPSVESRYAGVAGDIQRLAAFWREQHDRSVLVGYEELFTDPLTVCSRLCQFLEIPFERRMSEYGRAPHGEGYGDENTRAHDRPHTRGIDRWRDGLDESQQLELLELCGAEALSAIGMDGVVKRRVA